MTRWLAAPVRGIIWVFDLDDGRGNPSFSKMLIAALTVLLGRMMWNSNLSQIGPSVVAVVIALVAGAMGRHMFGKFLDRNTFTTNQTATVTADLTKITEAVLKRRDHDAGIDPA